MPIIQQIKPKHLRLVLMIAETKQLQLAAQAVAISQPAASRILSDLEKVLGSQLFSRHPAGMEPTQAGEVLLRHARVVLSELKTMNEELISLRSGASGHVRVGAVTGPAVGYLMPAIQTILQRHPDVHVSIDVAPSNELFRRLEEARYDFIMGRILPGHEKVDFRFHPARSETVSLLVHASHPLAGKGVIDWATLADYPWVIQEQGSPIRMAVENTLLRNGVAVPTHVLESSSLLVALAQIAEGQAIASQTKEVANLLISPRFSAQLSVLETKLPIVVAPYFVIQSSHRKLQRAAELVLEEVLSRL